MSRPRRLLLALALLVVIAPYVVPLSPAGAAQSPNKPVTEIVDDTFLAPNLTRECGFDVMAHIVGTFTFDVQPSGVEFWRLRLEYNFTGPGGSHSFSRVENVTFTSTMSDDGALVETLTLTGTLLHHQIVPGHGALGNNSGREILQLTWQWDEELEDYVLVDEQLLFDAGQNDDVDDADYAIICDLLG